MSDTVSAVTVIQMRLPVHIWKSSFITFSIVWPSVLILCWSSIVCDPTYCRCDPLSRTVTLSSNLYEWHTMCQESGEWGPLSLHYKWHQGIQHRILWKRWTQFSPSLTLSSLVTVFVQWTFPLAGTSIALYCTLEIREHNSKIDEMVTCYNNIFLNANREINNSGSKKL